jgi:uncharacterized membrane protein YraQ (UPF0718 family)
MVITSRFRRSSMLMLPKLATSLLALLGLSLVWIASGLLLPAGLHNLSERLQGLVTVFLSIVIEALLFLLAGVVASSVIHLFVSPERVRRLTPRSPVLAALVGAWLGLLFPVCESGAVPTARRLLAKGAPLPMGLAFVLAAPAVNPIVIASTWVAFGGKLDIVLLRIGLTVIIATIVGLVLGAGVASERVLAIMEPDETCDHDRSDAGASWIGRLLGHASSEFFDMGRYLVVGARIAATLQSLVPQGALGAWPGTGALRSRTDGPEDRALDLLDGRRVRSPQAPRRGQRLRYMLLAVPLLLGTFVPARPLGAGAMTDPLADMTGAALAITSANADTDTRAWNLLQVKSNMLVWMCIGHGKQRGVVSTRHPAARHDGS